MLDVEQNGNHILFFLYRKTDFIKFSLKIMNAKNVN